ncbi:MAG: sensor histidine kinase [Bacteroidota bacterium]
MSNGNTLYRIATHSIPRHFFFAAGIILGVSIISYLFTDQIGYQTVSLILLFAVAVLSLALEVGPVLVAALLSALVWNFFFIPPHYTFAIGHPHDVLMFLTYFVIAAITGVLTTRIRTREKNSSALFALTKDLINSKTQDEVAAVAVHNIVSFFSVDTVLYLSTIDGEMKQSPHPSSTIPVDKKELNVAEWVFWNEKKAGRFVDKLPLVNGTYYPLSGPRYPLGVIGIFSKNTEPLIHDKETVFQNFIEQISLALEREQLNELAQKTAMIAESEKLYRTLFNSISHELRTPIAAIISATESLAQNHQQEFVGEIQTAAERLNRLVENLLDMTRLESGQLAPNLDWCDVNDLFRSSLQKLKEELSSRRVSIEIPEGMPLVRLDFGLMEQVLTNLLFNAVLYTPQDSTITLSAKIAEKDCIFTVSDNGPGFPAEALKHLFEKFYRVPGSRTGGTGLGLSIAKGFVEAHKGTITAANRPSGGAVFIITIPVETHLSIL